MSTANAATYYVKVGGNNASAGTSWGTAWAHPNKTNSAVTSGDIVYFESAEFDTVDIRPVAGVTYTCTSSTVKPILHGGMAVTGAWDQYGATAIWAIGVTPGVYEWETSYTNNIVCYARVGAGTKDSILQGEQSIAAVNANGEYYYNRSNDSLYVRTFDGSEPGSGEIRWSTHPVILFTTETQDVVTFNGLDIRGGYQGAVVLASAHTTLGGGGSDSITFRNCNIGFATTYDQQNPAAVYHGQTYGSNLTSWGRFLTFVGCTLHSANQTDDRDGPHAGYAMELYAVRNLLIDSCVLGIKCNAGSFGLKLGNYDKYGHYADSVFLRNSVCHSGMSANVWVGNSAIRFEMTGCVLDGKMGATGYDVGFYALTSDGATAQRNQGSMKIWNNTFINAGQALMQLTPWHVNATNSIKYNIFYDSISDPYYGDVGFRNQDGNSETPASDTYYDIDSNMYWFGADAFDCEFQAESDFSGTNWAAWQAASFDTHSTNDVNPYLSPTTYATTNATAMSRTHSGRTWTVYGAIQAEVECADTLVAPVFESPANGATGQQNSVILDWSDSTQAGTVDVYDLQVDNNSDFSSVTFSSSPTDSRDTVTTTLTHLTTYYWRVRSRSDCDTSAWSGYRTFVVDNYTWTMPAQRDNPLNSWLDSNSTLDDHTIYLCGMDAATPPDADTLGIEAKWKIIIWSAGGDGETEYGAMDAVKLKQYDSTTKLILYSSLDHGLQTVSTTIDTSDAGGNIDWNGMTDEYSHYKATATDSGANYYSLFYHFSEATKILLYPSVRSSYYRYDTVAFEAATLPISDDDSNSVVPDFYSSTFFTSYGTIALTTADTIEGGATDTIKARWDYVGTPLSGKVTRVYPDFSNPLARYADLKYQTRVFATDYNNLGGTGDNVYGWGAMSDSGFSWDGIYLDNSGDHQVSPPEGSTLISGGNIRNSTGVIGSWYADTTLDKMNADMKTYFAYLTDYCNDSTNFTDGKPRATAANFGTWTTWLSSRNGARQWYNDSNRINLKLIENSYLDGGYSSYNAYEATNGNGRTLSDLATMDSLADANDFYVMFSGRVNQIDTSVASGYSDRINPLLRSNWVRAKTALGHRGLFAVQPIFAVDAINWQPCNSGGYSYQGLNYSPYCNDRAEVDSFVTRCTLPFFHNYDLGQEITDSSTTVELTDSSDATTTIHKSFWRDVVGTDTTYSWMYYAPRDSSSWDYRQTGLHATRITPPSASYELLNYDGTTTAISGASQLCWIGDQLILTYTTTGAPAEPSVMNVLRGTTLKGVVIK